MIVPKFLGRDCELSTSGSDAAGEPIKAWDVSRAVIENVDAAYEPYGTKVWTPRSDGWLWGGKYGGFYLGSAYSTDCLRHWAPDGKCFYVDMSHVEVCTAPALSPRAFAAQVIGALLVAEAARKCAEQRAELGTAYRLSASNADPVDPAISWGSHLNVSVSHALWEDLCLSHDHPAILGFVASAIAAAVPFFGAGYVLLPGDGTARYSLSARAHHITRVLTLATTEAFGRGLLNTRREPHARACERLHLIGFDQSLASEALLGSFMQCVLAAAEEGYCGHVLFDPVRATHAWSWQIDLKSGALTGLALLADGERITLPAYMRRVATALIEMCDSGFITDAVAPEAREMLGRIVELTRYAEEGAVARLGRHLTWAAKLLHLLDLCARRGATFADPAVRLADHDFLDTGAERGAFWRLWRSGRIDPLIELRHARKSLLDGPPESSAWGRGRLIQRFGADITSVEWDRVVLRRGHERFAPLLCIEMPRLDSLCRTRCEQIIRAAADASDLECLTEDASAEARLEDPVGDVSRQLAVLPRGEENGGAGARP